MNSQDISIIRTADLGQILQRLSDISEKVDELAKRNARLVSPKQYAAENMLSEATVRRMCARGEIDAIKGEKLWMIRA